jgi:hypothetical protein
MDLLDGWKQEYRSQRAVETTASFRKKSKAISVSDWDQRLKKSKGAAKNAPGRLF